jgi:hypothetical protein
MVFGCVTSSNFMALNLNSLWACKFVSLLTIFSSLSSFDKTVAPAYCDPYVQ